MSPRTYDKTFLPLESNPDIFTSLAHNLGLSPTLKFTEVYDLDEAPANEILAYVLAFPTSEDYEEMVEARDANRHDKTHEAKAGFGKKDEAKSTDAIGGNRDRDDKVVWLRQTIHNACGLYALIHSTCNGVARNHLGVTFSSSFPSSSRSPYSSLHRH